MPPSRGQCTAIALLMQAIQDAATGRCPDLPSLHTAVEDAADGDPTLGQSVAALERGDLVAAKAAVRCALDRILGPSAEPDWP